MTTQITVRLPPDLGKALDRAARTTRQRRSEIVRLALRRFVTAPDRPDTPAGRARNLLGSLQSGVPDLAENHRAHILKSLERGQ
jgi:Arc/MetJ-type ribon-helix-helix transcriptional regulator